MRPRASSVLTLLAARVQYIRREPQFLASAVHNLFSLNVGVPGLSTAVQASLPSLSQESVVSLLHNVFQRGKDIIPFDERTKLMLSLQQRVVSFEGELTVHEFALVMRAAFCGKPEQRFNPLRAALLNRLRAVLPLVATPADFVNIVASAGRGLVADTRVYELLTEALPRVESQLRADDILVCLRELSCTRDVPTTLAAAQQLVRVLAEAAAKMVRGSSVGPTTKAQLFLALGWTIPIDAECRAVAQEMLPFTVVPERLARAHPRTLANFLVVLGQLSDWNGDAQLNSAFNAVATRYIASESATSAPDFNGDVVDRVRMAIKYSPRNASGTVIDELLTLLLKCPNVTFPVVVDAVQMIERQAGGYLTRYRRIADAALEVLPTAAPLQAITVLVAVVGALFPAQRGRGPKDPLVDLERLAQAIKSQVLATELPDDIPTALAVRYARTLSKLGVRNKSVYIRLLTLLSERTLSTPQARMIMKVVVRHQLDHRDVVSQCVAAMFGYSGAARPLDSFSDAAMFAAANNIGNNDGSLRRGDVLVAISDPVDRTLQARNRRDARIDDAVLLISGLWRLGLTTDSAPYKMLLAFFAESAPQVEGCSLLSRLIVAVTAVGPLDGRCADDYQKIVAHAVRRFGGQFAQAKTFGDGAAALLWLPCMAATNPTEAEALRISCLPTAMTRINDIARTTRQRNTFCITHLAMCARLKIDRTDRGCLDLLPKMHIEAIGSDELVACVAATTYWVNEAPEALASVLDTLDDHFGLRPSGELVLMIVDLAELLLPDHATVSLDEATRTRVADLIVSMAGLLQSREARRTSAVTDTLRGECASSVEPAMWCLLVQSLLKAAAQPIIEALMCALSVSIPKGQSGGAPSPTIASHRGLFVRFCDDALRGRALSPAASAAAMTLAQAEASRPKVQEAA